ncbi:hypothetical protein SALBM217S_00173 [Streptomyces griseoloalbus]
MAAVPEEVPCGSGSGSGAGSAVRVGGAGRLGAALGVGGSGEPGVAVAEGAVPAGGRDGTGAATGPPRSLSRAAVPPSPPSPNGINDTARASSETRTAAAMGPCRTTRAVRPRPAAGSSVSGSAPCGCPAPSRTSAARRRRSR